MYMVWFVDKPQRKHPARKITYLSSPPAKYWSSKHLHSCVLESFSQTFPATQLVLRSSFCHNITSVRYDDDDIQPVQAAQPNPWGCPYFRLNKSRTKFVGFCRHRYDDGRSVGTYSQNDSFFTSPQIPLSVRWQPCLHRSLAMAVAG